jgi:hypothetical protein
VFQQSELKVADAYVAGYCGRGTVRIVRLALLVVVPNDGNYMDLIMLYYLMIFVTRFICPKWILCVLIHSKTVSPCQHGSRANLQVDNKSSVTQKKQIAMVL